MPPTSDALSATIGLFEQVLDATVPKSLFTPSKHNRLDLSIPPYTVPEK
jgi:hypothetical protein